MKKLLQTTLLISTIAGSAYGNTGDLMYVRSDATFTKFNTVSVGSNKIGTSAGGNSLIASGRGYNDKGSIGGIFGVGYFINDKARAELVYNKIFDDSFKYDGGSSPASFLSGTTFVGKSVTSKARVNVDAVLGRVTYDFLDAGRTKGFVGCAIGIAYLRHKTMGNIVINIPGDPSNGNLQSYNIASKNKNNLAYSLMLGATTKIIDNLHLEISYQFTDYGHTAKLKGQNNGRIALRSQNVAIGLRFDVM